MMQKVTKQEKEDYLETMYLLMRKYSQITKKQLSEHLKVPIHRVSFVIDELIESGYVKRDHNRKLGLTTIGENKGREYLEKHQCLTQFLQLVSGVDPQIAENNACEIEHVLDDTVYMGIRAYMEKRHAHAYTMEHTDLNFLFPESKRQMPIAIYENEVVRPRKLAEEYHQLKKKAFVTIDEESYLYLIPEENALEHKNVWYLYKDSWVQAPKKENGYEILTEALTCNIRQGNRLTQGRVKIAIEDEMQDKVNSENVRVLLISLI